MVCAQGGPSDVYRVKACHLIGTRFSILPFGLVVIGTPISIMAAVPYDRPIVTPTISSPKRAFSKMRLWRDVEELLNEPPEGISVAFDEADMYV